MRGKVWLLNVWASWCVSCRDEHPLLVELARSAASCRSSASTTRTSATTRERWLAQHGNPYALSVVDDDGRVGIDYGVYGVPETFVIDKAGRDPLQADRPDHARDAADEDPAAACGSCRSVRRAARRRSLLALRSRSRSRAGRARRSRGRRRPAVEQRLDRHRRGAALPRLPEPDARRLARRSPSTCGARSASADPPGQDRRRDHRLPGQPLRRLRALPAAVQADAPGCCGSARSRCSCSASARSSPTCGAGRRRAALSADEQERAALLGDRP